MNLSKYIRQLLPENEQVIFPGLGVFFPEYKPAQIHKDSEEITPPAWEISFNPKIRQNDGLLAAWVAQNEHISVQKALQEIDNERETLFSLLDKGEKVHLEKMGHLFFDENRELKFESSAKENLFPDAFGLEKTSLKEEQKKDPISVIPEEIKTEPIQKTEHPTQEKLPKSVSPQKEQVLQKKKRGWLWLLLFLIPLIAAGIFFLYKQKPKPGKTTVTEIKAEPPKAKKIEHPATDTLTADIENITPADTIKPAEESFVLTNYIEPDTAKFYLVGGSFQDAKNAEKFVQKMNKKGYEPFHLGKQGSFYLVGLEIYDNEIEAYGAQYNFLDKFPDSGVWVFIPE